MHSADSRSTGVNPPPKIGVCGELIGGSLAAMLALTECHEYKHGISAAVVGNPIADWTALTSADFQSVASRQKDVPSEIQKPNVATISDCLIVPEASPGTQDDLEDNGSEEELLSIENLLRIRDLSFRKPEQYFDPFASPLLFFRTPSSDLPYQLPMYQSTNQLREELETTSEPGKKRRSHRKYPPADSGLLLPHMRVEVGKGNLLRDQGAEFVDLMRRSYARSSAEATSRGENLEQRTFDLVEREGLGIWGRQEMLEIGAWFGKVLREP